MKKLTILLAVLSMILVGCDKEDAGVKDVSVFFFPSTEEMYIDLDPADPFTEKKITVSRYDSTNIYPATTIGVSVLKNTNDVYTVPATLTFGEGEKDATLTVAFGTLTPDENYELAVTFTGENFNSDLDIDKIGGEVAPDAGYTYAMSIWPLGMSETKTGVWVDGFIDDWFGGGNIPFYVDYQIEWVSGGIRRIHAKDVYSRAGNGEDPDEHGIYKAYPEIETSELLQGTYDLIIDINPDSTAIMQEGTLGFDWGYGSMIVRSAIKEGAYVPGTWDGKHLFFSAADKTTVTKLPEFDNKFYYCSKDVEFFASKEAFMNSNLYIKNTPQKLLTKRAHQIRRLNSIVE